MKAAKLLIMLSAFLIMISSVFTLMATSERTGVYLNVGYVLPGDCHFGNEFQEQSGKTAIICIKSNVPFIWATAP